MAEPGLPPPGSPPLAGDLVFEELFFDFGKVTEGEVVKHQFRFKNPGNVPVNIRSVKTSCGCTVADIALREYAPGESGTLEVAVDTRNKKGLITKTVQLFGDDGEVPVASVQLMASLVPPPHPEKGDVLQVTTDPKCKSCHLDSGVGFDGGFLYHRVCAQCHGVRGKGASAMGFSAQWQEKVRDGYLADVIKKGLPERKMPPFAEGVAPPLSEGQVSSLVEYIRSLR